MINFIRHMYMYMYVRMIQVHVADRGRRRRLKRNVLVQPNAPFCTRNTVSIRHMYVLVLKSTSLSRVSLKY